MATLKDALVKSGLATTHEVAVARMSVAELRAARDAVIRSSLGLPTLAAHSFECPAGQEQAALLAINAVLNAAQPPKKRKK